MRIYKIFLSLFVCLFFLSSSQVLATDTETFKKLNKKIEKLEKENEVLKTKIKSYEEKKAGTVYQAEGFQKREKDQNWWFDLSYLFLVEHVDGEDLFWADKDDDDNYDSSEKMFNTDKALKSWSDSSGNFGWRGELGYLWPSGWGLSVAYMGRLAEGEVEIDDGDLQPRFGDSSNNTTNVDLPDFEDAYKVHMNLDTSLHSVEVNVLLPPRQLNECTQLWGLVGPRFIWIKDNMAIESYDVINGDGPYVGDPGPPNDRSDLYIDTENFLGGIQTGLGLHWQPCPWFGLFTNVNAGVYYADIDQKVRFKEFDSTHDKWESKDSGHAFGFLGEARIAGELMVTKNFGVRMGYMLLYLSETGRAINQIQPGEGLDEDADDTESPNLNKDYTFYHGVMASAIIRW